VSDNEPQETLIGEYPPELVETVAIAVCVADHRNGWGSLPSEGKWKYRDMARAVLDAITASRRAIVELPEQMTDRSNVADSIKDQPMWLEGDSWSCLGAGDMEGLVEFEAHSQNVYGAVTNTGAKTLAAVLLAAVAEREDRPVSAG